MSERILIHHSSSWTVRLNKFGNFPVETASSQPEEKTVWDVVYLQDIFQAECIRKNLLLDVGWYPDGDPDGEFRLVLLDKRTGENEFDWDNPLFEYKSRSLNALIAEIENLLK